MTRRRWIADEWDDTTATLKGAQADHLARVLRARSGMEFDMVAGTRVWRASISAISEDAVTFSLLHEVGAVPALPVTLLLAIFKFDRMEWLLEKATELGVERLIPIVARRSEKHMVQAAPARIERWRRIVHEAAKQSRRSDVPLVEDILPLATAARMKAAEPGVNLLLTEQERTTTLYAALQPATAAIGSPHIHLALGPEGGWTPEEETSFSAEKWQPVTLGPRILRAETAGVSAVAIVAALLD